MTTEPLIVLVVDDEYARYFGQPTRDTGKSPAVQWLETTFICQWATGAFVDEELVPGTADIRPMIELIDQEQDTDDDCYGPMIISQDDYDDPGRWWL